MRIEDISWAETYAENHHCGQTHSGRAAQLGVRAFGMLPHAVAGPFAGALGGVASRRMHGRPFVARLHNNVERLRPDLSMQERQRLVARWWRQVGRLYADYAKVEAHFHAGRLTVDGEDRLRNALATGRPLVLTMVHTGFWEIVAPWAVESFGGAIATSWQPQRSVLQNRIVAETRQRMGFKALPPSPRLAARLSSILREGDQHLILFIDEVSERSVKFPLFGRDVTPRCNLVFALKAAAKANALLLPCHIVRVPRGRFRLTISEPHDATSFTGEVGVQRGAQALSAFYEPHIRDHLDEWYMLPSLKL